MSIKNVIQELDVATIGFTAPDTISDSADGLGIFAVGDKLTITNTASNQITVTVLSVTDGVITTVEQTITTEAEGTVTLQSNLTSEWIQPDHLDLRSPKLPSIAGVGTWGSGTLHMQVSFEQDKSNPFTITTGLTADGIEATDFAGAKWARLLFAGATAPDLTTYMGF